MILRRLVGRLAAAVASDDSTENESEVDGGARFPRADRSQSEVVGTVLLFGLSMFVIGTSLTLGGVAVADLLSDAESDNVENGMSHLSSKISLVALGDADTQRFSFGSMREGTVAVRPDAGTITISKVTDGSREVLNDKTQLGAIVYEGSDREIAYQGGGIWTKEGNASRLVSPPEYYYRGTTLTLPIINVTGEGAAGDRPSGRITPVDVATNAVPGVSSPLDSGVIEVAIQSEYYQGWHEFLSQRTEGVTTINHSNQTVMTRLTVPDNVVFDTALSVGEPYSPHPSVSRDIESFEQNSPHRSAKPIIRNKISEAETSGVGSGCLGQASTCELDAGTYLYDGDLSLDGDLEFDTSEGDITVIVDGTFDIENHELTVTDTTSSNNSVTYYINDSLQATGNAVVDTDNPTVPEADRNVFYVGKGLFDSSSGIGTVRFDAVIYAPDAALEINGNGEFTGSIIVERVDDLKGSIEVKYDSNLAGTSIDLTGAGDLITYLHVSHNEIHVEMT